MVPAKGKKSVAGTNNGVDHQRKNYNENVGTRHRQEQGEAISGLGLLMYVDRWGVSREMSCHTCVQDIDSLWGAVAELIFQESICGQGVEVKKSRQWLDCSS